MSASPTRRSAGRRAFTCRSLVGRYLYAAMLNDPRSDVRSVLLPGWQAAMARLVWPATRRAMIAALDGRASLVPALGRELAAELEWFDGVLAGRRYLVDDRFGRANITAASLLGPLARPSECPIYGRGKLPSPVEETLARWRARRSLDWGERIYAEHRR